MISVQSMFHFCQENSFFFFSCSFLLLPFSSPTTLWMKTKYHCILLLSSSKSSSICGVCAYWWHIQSTRTRKQQQQQNQKKQDKTKYNPKYTHGLSLLLLLFSGLFWNPSQTIILSYIHWFYICRLINGSKEKTYTHRAISLYTQCIWWPINNFRPF